MDDDVLWTRELDAARTTRVLIQTVFAMTRIIAGRQTELTQSPQVSLQLLAHRGMTALVRCQRCTFIANVLPIYRHNRPAQQAGNSNDATLNLHRDSMARAILETVE